MELTDERLEYLVDATPGIKGIYQIKGNRLCALYLSSSLHKTMGMERDEYARIVSDDAANTVLPDDLPALMHAVSECIRTREPMDHYWRVYHPQHSFIWVHGNARYCGERDGYPVLFVSYGADADEAGLYKEIVDNSHTMAYICDCRTHEILYANKAAMEYGGNTEERLGLTCYSYIRGKSSPCEDCFMEAVGRGEETSRDRFNDLHGTWEHLTGRYITWRGRDAFIQYVSDVTELIEGQEELRDIIDVHRLQLQATQVLNEQGDLDRRMNDALKIMREYYEADRTYVFLNDKGGATVSNTYECCRDGVTPQIEGLQRIDRHYMDRWTPYFDQHRLVMQPDIEDIRETDPDEYEIMFAQGINSYIEAPLVVNGDWIGFIGADNPPKSKFRYSPDLLLSFAFSVGNTIARARAEQKILRDQQQYTSAVESAGLGVWIFDIRERRIISASKSFGRYGFEGTLENVPDCLLPLCDPSDRGKLADLFRRVEEGESGASADIWMRMAADEPLRCWRLICTIAESEDGNPTIAYGVEQDITDQVQERTRFQRTIQSMLSAYPDAIGSYRLNLTQNLFLSGNSSSDYIERALPSKTADGFFENAAAFIADGEAREEYLRRFGRTALLAAAESGETYLSTEYQSNSRRENTWIRVCFTLIRNPETSDIECVTYALDITKEKRSAEIFNRITDQEYDYVALLHMNSNEIEFLHLNSRLSARYQNELGIPEKRFDFDSIRKFTANSWVYEDDRGYYLENSPVPSVREHLDRDGHFEMSLRGHLDNEPDQIMCRRIQHYYLDDDHDTVLIVQTDVTQTYLQQQQDIERAKLEAKHAEDIIDSVATGICVFRMPDEDHLEGEFVNLQMFRILGLTPLDNPDARQEMMRDPMVAAYMKDAFIAVYPDDCDKVRKAFHDGYNTDYFNGGNYRIMKNDGKPIWVNQDAILREVRPDCRVFYATYRVVEHEMELQDELGRQLEKEKLLRDQADAANASKSDFLSRMSHDMRTPLNGIIGMTYLTQEMDLPEKARENLEKIDVSSKFLLNLINEVLDMSKAESGTIELHLEPYDSADFFNYLDSVIMPLCDEKGIDFIVDAKPVTSVQPLMDTMRINQVFFNLLSNAVKFTPEGGTVVYRLREHVTEDGRLALRGEVSDTGIGMSEEFQEHLFEPFSQEMRKDNSQGRGTGLGLAIAKKLLDIMGCRITVKSTLGEGTTFALAGEFDCVPAADDVAGAKAAAEPAEFDFEGVRILLCEDHPLNQEIAKTLLNDKNAIVNIADDGQQGLADFADSSTGYYSVILMDIRMPVMDGYETTRAIRALERPDAKTVPIIAMTADAYSEDVQKCLDAGMDGHIAKPIDPAVLFQTIEDALGK